MVLISIDQSLSSTGMMVWDKEANEKIVWLLSKTKTKQELILRIREQVENIKGVAESCGATDIVIESLPFGINSRSVRPLAALYYQIHSMCIDEGINFHEANVTAVKKFATTSGKAKKDEMVAAFLEDAPKLHAKILKDGVKKTTGLQDLADAYFIGKFHLNKVEKESNDKTPDF